MMEILLQTTVCEWVCACVDGSVGVHGVLFYWMFGFPRIYPLYYNGYTIL